jgi:putative NADPH-quinone reductase
MTVLLVTAHPLADSFHGALTTALLTALAGREVDHLDLYAEGFNPVLSAAEREGYHAIPANQTPVAREVARLCAADVLILQFPVWIFGPPAILKGWFDRVLLPGVAFRLEAGRVTPGLTNLKRVIGCCSYGTTRWFAWAMGDPPRKLIERYFRFSTGGAGCRFLPIYNMNRATTATRARYLARTAARVAEEVARCRS